MIDRMSNIIQTLKYKTVQNVVGFLVFFSVASAEVLDFVFYVIYYVVEKGRILRNIWKFSIICVVNHFNALYISNIYNFLVEVSKVASSSPAGANRRWSFNEIYFLVR